MGKSGFTGGFPRKILCGQCRARAGIIDSASQMADRFDGPSCREAEMNEPLDVAMDTAGIARITINRPKRANSIDPALAASMFEALDWLANDPKLRVLVLLGNGRTFCAGLDLKALPATMAAPFDENYADALKFAKLLHRLHTMPVPTLAIVPGAAIGLGVGFIACCDIALA